MIRRRGFEAALIVPMTLGAALFLVKLVRPTLVSHGVWADPQPLRWACVLKLAFLLFGGLVALRNCGRLESGNPIRPAWLNLSLGLLSSFLGQASLAPYQFSKTGEAPFPSIADLFFIAGYPFFLVSLFHFLRAYAASGYALGSARERRVVAALVSVVCVAIGAVVLWPVLRTPAPSLARFLNVAYPVLDLALLVPTVLLLRAALPLRGGEVWQSWAALLAGFLFMSAGDVSFAYFQSLGVTHVDPLVHATFLLSYGFLALGVVRQYRLLAS